MSEVSVLITARTLLEKYKVWD